MTARTTASLRGQRGFSLVELMVALVVTLIISTAIYGLLTSSGNAFRREPEVADRQQNIRVAMDVISRDVENAGAGMPVVSQVFTHTDDPLGGPAPTGSGSPYLNGAGPGGVMGAAGQDLRGGGATGAGRDGSDATDVLEMVMGESACPAFRVCAPAAVDLDEPALTIFTREETPTGSCLVPPGEPGAQGLVLMTDNRLFTVRPAVLLPPSAGCGGSAATNGELRLEAALPEWPLPAGQDFAATGGPPTAGTQALLYAGKVVRYRIAPGLDPLDTSPSLWRSETGRYDGAGALSEDPAPGATNWQLVARGIEDLQVEYLNGNNLWANNPGVVNPCALGGCAPANYTEVVRRVRVTLSARATAPLLAGETRPAGGNAPNAIRGQLVTVLTPRAAVLGLQAASTTSSWQ